MRRRLLILTLLLLSVPGAGALAQDTTTMLPISYGQQVSGDITDQQIFAHWQLLASAGDRLLIRMSATGGLRPLIGILDPDGTLLVRSDDGEVDGTVQIDFTAPAADQYRIVATRVGNQSGTTTGSYVLRVDLLNAPPTRDPAYQDVTFLCGADEATALSTISFAREPEDNGAYSLRLYGLDGFQPVIRVQTGGQDTCTSDPADAVGDVITLPGERPITLTDASATTQVILTDENADPQAMLITIGSANDQPGRYLAVIGGFNLEPSTDTDDYPVRLAPRPAQGDSPLLIYAVGLNNRLDPSITDDLGRCDDAGRRGCEDVPSFDGAGVIFNGGIRVIGDRFDAGLRIGDADQHNVQVFSFSGTTHGAYALLLIGSLPPRPTP